MFPEDSIYKKDKWLNNEKIIEVISANKELMVQFLKMYYEKIKEFGLNRNVEPEDINDFARRVLAEFIIKKTTDYEFRSPEAEKNLVLKIAKFRLFHYWRNSKQQQIGIEEFFDKIRTTDEWDSDEDYFKFKELRLQFMEDCINWFFQNGSDYIKKCLKMLLTQKNADETIKKLADLFETTEGGVKSGLDNIRKKLKECITEKLEKHK